MEASVGSVSDSYDNALAETINGLFKTEVVRRLGPWRTFAQVELAVLEWVDWFNDRRLLGPLGFVPPAEFEEQHDRRQQPPQEVTRSTNTAFGKPGPIQNLGSADIRIFPGAAAKRLWRRPHPTWAGTASASSVVCRYVARPPLAQDRLERHGDGRVRYSFKSAWKDGTCAVLLDPLDLIGRLCALVPPPRFHMLRYHGVLAANASARAEVVPAREPVAEEQLPLGSPDDGGPLEPPPPSRHPWAWLLRRVFAVDMARCPERAGPMRLLDVVTDADDIARVLGARGRDARAPPRPPTNGQLELDFGAA